MNTKTHIGMMLFATFTAVLLNSCASTSSTPPQISSVDSARSAYEKIADDDQVKQYAPVKLYQAQQEYQKLNDAVSRYADKDEIDHLANILQQRVQLAKMAAQTQMATDQINLLNKEQAQIQVELQQTRAQYARESAEQAALEAKQAQEKASSLGQQTPQTSPLEQQTPQTSSLEQQTPQTSSLEQQTPQTSSLEQQLQQIPSINVREETRGTVVTVADMFDFDKATLKSGAEQNLNGLLQILKQNPGHNLVIEGYTDSVGPSAYNQQLSRDRAQAVVNYLVSQGINRERLTARGYGESFPIASNENAAGRQANRRVDIVVLRTGEQPATAMRSQTAPGELSTFSELDKDKNGYLSQDETQPVQSLNNNFNQFDQNQDQQISRSEFSAFEETQIQRQ